MSIENSIQIIATIIGAIYGLIQIWKLVYNLDDKAVTALKNSISIVIWAVSLLVGLAGFSFLFVVEATSPDPISRFSIAKIVFFGVMLSIWLAMHMWYLLARLVIGHHTVIGGLIEIARKVDNAFEKRFSAASDSSQNEP